MVPICIGSQKRMKAHMYKVIEERKEIEEAVNTVVYEYDHESLDSAMKHIDLRNTQDCKCYIGNDDEKSKYRRSLMELDKEELIEKIMNKNSEICGVKIQESRHEPIKSILNLGKCKIYVTRGSGTYEEISDVEVTVMS